MMAILVRYASFPPCAAHSIDDIRRLKDVPDPRKLAPDGQTIEGQMQKLCVEVADDIRRCANACDTYLKSALFVPLFSLSLTVRQEEGTRKNTRCARMGGQPFEVR